jgi:hypothetical protein
MAGPNTWPTCRLEETEQRIDSQLSVPELGEFLKGECTRSAPVKTVFALVYGVLSVRRRNEKGAQHGAFFVNV